MLIPALWKMKACACWLPGPFEAWSVFTACSAQWVSVCLTAHVYIWLQWKKHTSPPKKVREGREWYIAYSVPSLSVTTISQIRRQFETKVWCTSVEVLTVSYWNLDPLSNSQSLSQSLDNKVSSSFPFAVSLLILRLLCAFDRTLKSNCWFRLLSPPPSHTHIHFRYPAGSCTIHVGTEDIRYIKTEYSFEPSLWSWPWKQQSNIYTKHSSLWWYTIQLNLVAKKSAVQQMW